MCLQWKTEELFALFISKNTALFALWILQTLIFANIERHFFLFEKNNEMEFLPLKRPSNGQNQHQVVFHGQRTKIPITRAKIENKTTNFPKNKSFSGNLKVEAPVTDHHRHYRRPLPDRLRQLSPAAEYCELEKEKTNKNETISKHTNCIRCLTLINR
jgi:hypothetical protein